MEDARLAAIDLARRLRNTNLLGKRRERERPASSMPSSPPRRFWTRRGRSVQGRM
jgi:hypothetical protein